MIMRRLLHQALAVALLLAVPQLAWPDSDTVRKGLDMTRLARRFARHSGPTILYVNFDGWSHYGREGRRVYPFRSMSGDRDRDIQDILCRAAQIFAPFDVQVCRRFGKGNYYGRRRGEDRGHTTIFVGADLMNVNGKGLKYPRSYTPWRHSDFPNSIRGTARRPHSNPYHLAFVDPMGQRPGAPSWVNLRTPTRLSKSIAHEAGHTFGLAHTLTWPTPDLMSYNARMTYFANRTFPVTDLNFDPATRIRKPVPWNRPRWKDVPITRQNSFTYLRTVLGARPPGTYARVADRSSVEPGYRDGRRLDLAPPSSVQGVIERPGDYQVFRLLPLARQHLAVSVQPTESRSLKPVLLVYSATGRDLLHFHNGRNAGERGSRVEFTTTPGRSYLLVAGAADGASRGGYLLTVRVARQDQDVGADLSAAPVSRRRLLLPAGEGRPRAFELGEVTATAR